MDSTQLSDSTQLPYIPSEYQYTLSTADASTYTLQPEQTSKLS